MADGKNRGIKLKTVYAIFAVLVFGIALIAFNVYQLYHLSTNHVFETSPKGATGRPTAWICSEKVYHLNHVIKIFEKLGYDTVHSLTPLSHWHIMWSFEFPFTKELTPVLKNLQGHHMVNHLPGSGFITLKVELATSKLKWIPKAFQVPSESNALLKEARLNKNNLWVQKSNDHRGIHIVSINGLDLSRTKSFVQLYISNPLLIDGRKFDIGVYVVVTSVDPLRVYIYEEEILVRFCQKDYEPFDENDLAKYVVGADYDTPSMMPSLQSYFNHGRFSRKHAMFGYLQSQGKDTRQLWKNIRQAIRETFIVKNKDMKENFSDYKSTHSFFELVRFDFVFDVHMNLWLMEVNMSPNLSSMGHAENAIMYEQVIFHAFQLTGVATLPFIMESEENEELMVQDRDITVEGALCRSSECLSSCTPKCELCIQCISDDMKLHFKRSFMEHTHRGNYRRVLPIPQEENELLKQQDLAPNGKNNDILKKWFYSKCIDNPSWCW